ncbi:MAG: transcription antitermination factor NusB [Candidatus Peribacteraceae bacterium]|nr:transcription antitermination factor NusB [Candidatus Peribacteraceae bacterium]
MARKRHLSRIAVMQALFEHEKRPVDPQQSLALNAEDLGDMDDAFARSLLDGVLSRREDLQRIIQEHAPDWSLDRMDPIARCTLLVGAYELLYGNDAPPAVVMNEAIEIAKEFGTGESGKFVNGVLNAIAQGKKA